MIVFVASSSVFFLYDEYLSPQQITKAEDDNDDVKKMYSVVIINIPYTNIV